MADAPGGERIVHCLQCGSCGGSCPSGADMEYTPRTLFAMINAGERDDGAGGQHDVGCVSCYFCTTRCPQNIPITDIMYALKRMSIAERRYQGHRRPGPGQDVHRLRGEVRAELRGRPGHRLSPAATEPLGMLKMGPMGLPMFTRGRMALLPTKIRQIDQLQAIIKKAKELSGKKQIELELRCNLT